MVRECAPRGVVWLVAGEVYRASLGAGLQGLRSHFWILQLENQKYLSGFALDTIFGDGDFSDTP